MSNTQKVTASKFTRLALKSQEILRLMLCKCLLFWFLLFSATSEPITKDKSHFAPFLFVYKCTKVNQKMKTEIVMWASLFSRWCFTEINHTVEHRRKSLELVKPYLIKPRAVFVRDGEIPVGCSTHPSPEEDTGCPAAFRRAGTWGRCHIWTTNVVCLWAVHFLISFPLMTSRLLGILLPSIFSLNLF